MKALLKRMFSGTALLDNPVLDLHLGGNRGAPNVLIFTEHLNATYFISFDIPLRALHAKGKYNFAVVAQATVASQGEDCWRKVAEFFRPDIVVMTRYGSPYGPEIVEGFKGLGIPVIYHIDDNLLNIPPSLGAEIQKRQGAQDVIESRAAQLAGCDLIYASTARLAAELGRRFPAQPIFHGIYAPYLGDALVAAEQGKAKPIIGYMGSKGHQEDIELVAPAVERLLNERPELRFEIFGTIQMPPSLAHFGNRVSAHKVNKSYQEFLKVLSDLGWQVGLAPLVNEPFNLCKAPTKYIEYTAAGIPVIASNVPVYADVIPNGGGLLVDDDWYMPLVAMLDGAQLRGQTLATARAYCSENFSTRHLEMQLMNVMEKVLRR